MSGLIKRIEAWIENGTGCESIDASMLLVDCKAEILRLLLSNETLKGLCEDYQAQIKQLEQAREYVPMSLNELDTLDLEKNTDLYAYEWEKIVEAEVVKRAGLVVKEKE